MAGDSYSCRRYNRLLGGYNNESMKMSKANRDIESDLKGLESIFRKCFKRNERPVPPYKGQDIQRKHYDGFLIAERFKPGSEANEYETERRDLVQMLLGAAYQLGYDLCYVTKYQEAADTNKAIGEVIQALKEKHEADSLLIVESLINMAKLLPAVQYMNVDKKLSHAISDLRENTELLELLNKKNP
jgi:hypothetical protein